MKKSILVELDKIRNLRFGTNAICQIEDMLEKPISSLQEGAGFKELRVMLYAGLVWEDSSLTLESVGDLMDVAMAEQGTEYLGKKIGEAIELAMPNKKKKIALEK